jgi:hypothetical protein
VTPELAQAVDRVEALLADPARRRELALRIVELEERVLHLEEEVKRVDQRLTKARLDRWDVP